MPLSSLSIVSFSKTCGGSGASGAGAGSVILPIDKLNIVGLYLGSYCNIVGLVLLSHLSLA